ncbi:hypothetical protein [Streptomyces sp. C10-9-1]
MLRDNVVRHRDLYLAADPRERIASYLESLPAVDRPMPAPIAG